MKWLKVLGAVSLLASALSAQNTDVDVQRAPRFLLASNGREPVAVDVSRVARLRQRLALDLDGATIKEAVRQIVRQSGMIIWYSDDALPRDMRVHLKAENITVAAALTDVLMDSGVDVVFSADGSMSLAKRSANASVPAVGIISGKVVDSTSKDALSGATVTVEGTKLSATTDSKGSYTIRSVAEGKRKIAVRRLGYKSTSREVTVAENETVVADFVLMRAATMLEEVVSTASGQQRRLEVGHVINHVNADSIAPTAPITSLTDLLTGRAAGVQVLQTNGLVGSGVGIRIRGQSSMVLNSDPIVIVDGQRQDNTVGGGYSGWYGGYTTPSRLNDIDFSQVESVDILSGPAASTEYGTDAANGVIVIKTKRGRPGKTQWHASAERGFSEVPNKFTPTYWTHGTWTAAGTAAKGYSGYVYCPIISLNGWADQESGYCTADSMTVDNPLNHKETTTFRSGLRDRWSLDLSGGTEAVRYYLAGSSSNDVGTIHMPRVFEQQAINIGLPPEALKPNTNASRTARTNIAAQLSPKFDVSIHGAYMTTDQISPAATQGSLLLSRPGTPAILDSVHNYGYAGYAIGESPLYALGSWTTEKNNRATAGARADWQPASWFTAYATFGVDHSSNRNSFLWHPVAYGKGYYSGRDEGWLGITESATNILSLDARGSLTHQFTDAFRTVTSVGYQVTRNLSEGVFAGVQQVSESNISLNGVPNPEVREISNASATLGGYVEQHLNLAERLFMSAAVRVDGASGFGNDHRVSAYPKINASWLAIRDARHTLRLRAAFGTAGQQPNNGASLQTYYATTVWGNDIDRSGYVIGSAGNPNLRPEKSVEFEAGLDATLFDDRFSLALSRYEKRTEDALTSTGLGLTGGYYSAQENLGDIKNWGYEASVNGSLVRLPVMTWDLSVTASRNRNKLVKLANDATPSSDAFMYIQQNRVGYPLYGYWAPRATYSDANSDGIIQRTEITVEDTNTYIGTSLPTVETGWASTMGFLGGRFTLNALFDHRLGGMIANRESYEGTTNRSMHDRSAPLWMQARDRACSYCQTSLNFEEGWFVRFREMSATIAMPQSWLNHARFQTASFTMAVRNLALWTHYTGVDPESRDPGARVTTGGPVASVDAQVSGNMAVPMPRTWMFRVNLGF